MTFDNIPPPVKQNFVARSIRVTRPFTQKIDAHRIFDLAFTLTTFPFWGLIYLLITIPLIFIFGSNPIFTQIRIGQNGRRFKVFKFRTMNFAGTDVPNAYCHFLRKHSLDELPQLINVLRGDMGLVGPRCHMPDMRLKGRALEDIVPGYQMRFAIRPGITGLAQVKGYRGALLNEAQLKARIAADIEYINTRSVVGDIKIILKTIYNELFVGTGS